MRRWQRLLLAAAFVALGATVHAQTVTVGIPPNGLMPPVIVFPASAVNGAGVVTSPQLLLQDGSVSVPSLGFLNDPNLGIWRSGSGVISWASAGARTAFLTSSGFTTNALTLDVTNQDVGVSREGAGHSIQKNSTNAQRFSVANTYTSASNNELFSVDWQAQAGTATVGTRTAATGTRRALFLGAQDSNGANSFSAILFQGALPFIQMGYLNNAGANISNAGTGTWFELGHVTSTASSGTVVNTAIVPTYNQSSTAAGTDFLINRTETAVGSGSQRLIDGQVGGNSRFYVTASGATGRATQLAMTNQTVPSCSASCGTSPSVVGSDTAMRVTMGATGTPASPFTVTFNGTWAAAPSCVAALDTGTTAVVNKVAAGTGTVVITTAAAPANSNVFSIHCIGIQ